MESRKKNTKLRFRVSSHIDGELIGDGAIAVFDSRDHGNALVCTVPASSDPHYVLAALNAHAKREEESAIG